MDQSFPKLKSDFLGISIGDLPSNFHFFLIKKKLIAKIKRSDMHILAIIQSFGDLKYASLASPLLKIYL